MSILNNLNVGDMFKLESNCFRDNNFYPYTHIEYNKIDYRGPLYFKYSNNNTIDIITESETNFIKTDRDYIVSKNLIYSLKDIHSRLFIGKNYTPPGTRDYNIKEYYKDQIPFFIRIFYNSEEGIINYTLENSDMFKTTPYRISRLSKIDRIKIALQ